MKVACPNCQHALKVPDDWAGRTAKCPHCKAPFVVPGEAPAAGDSQAVTAASKPAPASSSGRAAAGGDPDGLNLQALEGMMPDDKPAADPLDAAPPKKRRWGGGGKKPAEEAPKAVKVVRGEDGKVYRVCPGCGRQVRSDDPYMELFCSNCGRTIPATKGAEDIELPEGQTLIGGRGRDRNRTVGFYDGLVQAFGYPIGAMQSVLMGTLVAIGVIIIPTAILMGLLYVVKQEPVKGDQIEVGSWPGMALMGVLLFELIYCAGVGFYALIDSIRSTATGAEKPPELVFNLTTVVGSLVGYISFMVFYGLLIALGIKLFGNWPDTLPTTREQMQGLLGPGMYAYLAVLTVFIPMTIIGLAVGQGLQGLNPLRMVRSIASVSFHYMFLYCIVLVYTGLIAVAGLTMVGYTGEAIVSVYKNGLEQGAGEMALGVVYWGVLMAAGFYAQYVLGRILGLFAREFKYQMAYTS